MQVDVLEAQSQFFKLVQAAQAGEEVVIASNGVPVARVVPFAMPSGLTGWGCLKNVGAIDAAFSTETDAEVARLINCGQ